MPKFKNRDGLTVETSIPREAAQLRAEGFREVKDEKTTQVPSGLSQVRNNTEKPAYINKPSTETK